MKDKFLTYTNIKYNFKVITNIEALTKNDINKFNKLYNYNQISKEDYDIIINLLYKNK